MCKGLMGEMVCLQVMPDAFNVIQLRRVFGQPLDGEPVSAGGQRSQRELAGVDRTIVLDQHHRFERLARLRTVELIQLFKMGDEVAAALAAAGVHDELARDMIKRTEHSDLFRLSRRGHSQIGSCFRPGAGKIGMRQWLALVTVQQNDVARFGLLLAQLQTQADALDLGGNLAALQRVPWTPPAILFLRSALDNCARLICTPSRAMISLRSRGIVQFGRSAQALPAAAGPRAGLPRSSPAADPTPRWPSAPRYRLS